MIWGAGYAGGYYGGGYPYYGGAGGYPYGGGYPGYAYDEDNAYQQYASQEQYRQWSDYAAQQQYEDAAAQANYYNWAAANAYKGKHADVLKVANGASKAQSLVYMGDLEFGGYKHEITGGNDGGYNAPFDINGDGQEIDNWAKVTTQWKHKKGGKQLKNTKGATQLKQNKIQQLRLNTAQANAQVAGIFDDMAHSEHGANNGMLQKRAQHKPKVAPVDPKMQPVQSIFSVEGNGDVSVKGRSQQLAGLSHAQSRRP